MKVAVVTFPGSNCDDDCHHVFGPVLGQETVAVWHKEQTLPSGVDLVVLPGGFSYGDYLRTGALARFSPIMNDVVAFADNGGRVLGICNGFQILCEAGLLPGALQRNSNLKFICENVTLSVASSRSALTSGVSVGDTLTIPIAHHDGNYFVDADGLQRLKGEDQVLFRYTDNPNGSVDDIAGITNAGRNVFGMMPHPERIAETALGGRDGRTLLEGLLL
ncbi:MAG: phosphoribosylformylglycinamidine synthase I [Myxococcota bacterium]|jgi:phosphoribosylformylglycinamidine synthase I